METLEINGKIFQKIDEEPSMFCVGCYFYNSNAFHSGCMITNEPEDFECNGVILIEVKPEEETK